MSDLATQDRSTSEKAATPSFEGTFIWYELMTSDQDAAIAFYKAVVGWNADEQDMAELPFRYTILSAGGQPVAGLMELDRAACDAGARPGWIGVISVPDTDAATRKVVEAGGAIHMEPADIENVGRFAIVADPGGAAFEIMTPLPREDVPEPLARDAVGNIGWHELYAGQGQEDAFAFYSGQFGWKKMDELDSPMGKYCIFGKDGKTLGGMLDKPENVPGPAWAYYINVDAIGAAAERVVAQGGTILMGPHQVPNESWIVQALDPQGANFALVSKTR